MDFDPSTAQAAATGFDPSSAQPAAGGFDPSSAKEVPQHTGFLGALDAFNNSAPVKGMSGAFMQSVLNGVGGRPVQWAMESMGIGMDKLKSVYPGQSDDWYHQKLHSMYNDALLDARNQAQQQTANNPYPGHQVANFAANVAGSPEALLVPASRIGEGASLAARIGKKAVAGALVNSAMDDAYQAADMISDNRIKYDIARNLKATALGGIVGGAEPIVSDFTVGLFKNRGKDTTPSANPIQDTNTKPVSGTWSDEDHAAYQNVLDTGSVDDIKQFFDNKQGPRPSWQDVNQWVKYRDNVPQGFAQEEFKPQFQPDVESMKYNAQQHVDNLTKDWTNKPDVNIAHSSDVDLPQSLRDDPQALGMYDAQTGKVHLVADRLNGPDDVSAALFHEGLGHYGLAQRFGNSLDSVLNTLDKRNVGQFSKDIDAWQKKNPGAYGGDRTRAAEEVLAEKSEQGQIKPGIMDALVANTRRFGRQMGMKLNYSDGEVKTILAMAHDAVINGKGRDVVGNGFRYMFTGPTAFDYSEKNPTHFVANDGVGRNEINDSRAKINLPEVNKPGYLGDVLDHPTLYDQYPGLKNVTINRKNMEPGHYGSYDPETNHITFDANDPDPRSTILHETQHAVQNIEQYPGFQETNAKENMSPEEYFNNPIEKEAFATEARKDMNFSERTQNDVRFMRRREEAASPDYVVKNLNETYEALGKDYEPETQNWDEVRRAALQAGTKPSQIKDLADLKNLGERMYRIGVAAKMADSRLAEIRSRMGTPAEKVTDQLDAVNAVADYKYFLSRLQNNYSEIARALNVKKAIGYTKDYVSNVGKLIEEHGDTLSPLADRDTYERFMKQLGGLSAQGNQAGVQSMLNSVSQKPYWWQYLLSFRQQMMLSGLSTHIKSPQDMATNGLRDFEESILSLPGGLIRNGINAMGGKVQTGVHPTEIAGGLWGVARAAVDAKTYADTLTALKHGFGPGQNTTQVPMPEMPGVLGLPGRLVAMQDTFFRSFLHNANLYNLGTRQAYRELKTASNSGKVKWDDVMSLGSSYAQNPTAEMMAEAHEMANQTILMNQSPINSLIGQAKSVRPNMTGIQQLGSFVTNLLTTFTRIQSNAFMNQVVRRSPLAFLDGKTREDFAAGGAKRDIAIARAAMGTALMAMYWNAADPKKAGTQPQFTGDGPESASKRAALEASGWRPNALEENGHFQTGNTLNLSVNPLDIHNNTANMIANLRKAYEEGADKGDVATGLKLAFASVVHEFASSTFVNDIAPAVDAFEARGTTMLQKGQKVLEGEAKTFLPNLTTQIARISNPNQIDTGGDLGKTVQAAIPVANQGMTPKYSVYGEPLQTGTTLTGLHGFGEGNHTVASTDPAIKELSRLEKAVTGTLVSPTAKTLELGRDFGLDTKLPLKLTTDQAEEYQMYTGRTIVEAVRGEMQSPDWAKMSDKDKVDYVRTIETAAKKQVKEALLQKEGWLNPDQLSNLRSQLNGQ